MKDMLASLPQLTEAKDKARRTRPRACASRSRARSHLQLSLHLSMAQQCMSTFERRKLAEIAHVEQVRMALGEHQKRRAAHVAVAAVLCHWAGPGWQGYQGSRRRNGAAAR